MKPTIQVKLGRSRLPLSLADSLKKLPPGLRGRTVGFILQAHCQGVDLPALVKASDELRRLGILLNLSLKKQTVDIPALRQAVEKLKELYLQ